MSCFYGSLSRASCRTGSLAPCVRNDMTRRAFSKAVRRKVSLPVTSDCLSVPWMYVRRQSNASPDKHGNTASKPQGASAASSSAPPPHLSYRQQAMSPPNVITMTRIACTPVLSYCIIHDYTTAALIGCGLAGASDLADGWLARNFQQTTVLGTYLDPLADKILVNTLSISLWVQNMLPTPLVLLWFTRDVALMAGSYLYVLTREQQNATRKGRSNIAATNEEKDSNKQDEPLGLEQRSKAEEETPSNTWFNLPRTNIQVKPTLVSKVNTALQFLTLGTAIASPLLVIVSPELVAGDMATTATVAANTAASYASCSWHDSAMLQTLCWTTGATTIASGWSYLNHDAFKLRTEKTND